ncbi:PDZ domain-containing protein, partial [bacterium]
MTFTEDDLDKALDAPKKGETPAPPKTEIYEPGIFQRLRRLTTKGASGAAVSPDSRTIYASTSDGIAAINAATGASTAFLANRGGGLTVRNGKLYFVERGTVNAVTLGGPATPAPIAFSTTYTLDTKAEESALFEDVWWAIDRLYYDAKLNNKDWPAIRAKYAALVPYAYDRQDFYRMMAEMMEELDSSHLGATAPPAPDWGNGNESPAFLGIDFDPAELARGRYVVGRVIPNTPATLPSSLLQVGDRILSVDGKTATPTEPVAAMLNRDAGRKVILEIERAGTRRTIAIKPTTPGARTDAEYEAFVAQERAMTEKLSNGRIGYLHVRAMDAPSLQRFLREIRTEGEGKDGVIVDVRFNGGGSTAVDILAVLIRTPWLVRTTRGEFGTRLSENIYRGDALELPTALMIN